MNNQQLKIIANPHDLNSIQESWFIQNVLFGGVRIGVGFDPAQDANKKIIYLELNKINTDLIGALRGIGSRVLLYHMGDEYAAVNRDAYAECDLVVRNYFFHEIFDHLELDEKILWAPCGFKSGIGPRSGLDVKAIKERQYISIFSGWLENQQSFNNERLFFSDAVKKCGENIFLSTTSGFGGGWNVGLYAAMMESAIFAPCPAGNSPETIRLYDALELGCIPITLKHDYIFSELALGEFGQPPFAFLNSWDELPVFLEKMREQLINNLEEIQNWQSACLLWWTNYKEKLQEKILSRIDSIPVIGD